MDHNQLEEIRYLHQAGGSIRQIADQLSLKKYEVERALIQIKTLNQWPDSRPDSLSDNSPDAWLDDQADTAGYDNDEVLSPPVAPVHPKDMPSEWHKAVSRIDADFIIGMHKQEHDEFEIKAAYTRQFPKGYLALYDIQRVVDAFELESQRKQEFKQTSQQHADDQLVRNFNNYIGEDILAFIMWMHETPRIEGHIAETCVARAAILLQEIETFCSTHKLSYADYEPYPIIKSLSAYAKSVRDNRRKPEIDDRVLSFIEMTARRPNLDRYLYKLLEKSRLSSSRW